MSNSLLLYRLNRVAKKKSAFFCAGLVLACCVIAACTSEPAMPLRLGTNVWPGYEPLYLARELKYFDTEKIHLVEYSSATDVLRAYRNNAIDAAALTLDEVLLLAQDGEEPRIVTVLDYSHGADAILARPPIDEVKGLIGHQIAAENTAMGAYMLYRALDIAKMHQSEVVIVPATVDEHENIYNSGSVDAVVTFEPVRSRLLKSGAISIFDSKQIPGEILDVLVVRRNFAEKHPELITLLVSGWFKALDYINTSKSDAVMRMARREHTSPEDFMISLEGIFLPSLKENTKLLDGKNPSILTVARRLVSVMSDKRLLKHNTVNIEALPYPLPLRQVIESRDKIK